MSTPTVDSGLPTLKLHSVHGAVTVASIVSFLVGLLALAGWTWNVSLLKSGAPGLPDMTLDSAIALVALSGALWLSRTRRAILSVARLTTALLVLAVSGDSLVEDLSGYHLGLNRLIAELAPGGAAGVGCAEGMAPATALSFLLLSTTLVILTTTSVWARRLMQVMLLTCLLLATLVLVGYAYGFEALYRVAPGVVMPLPNAATFALLSIGLLYARSDFGVMKPLRSANMGGMLARQMLPAVLGIPLLLGWMRLVPSQHLGEQGFELGIIIHTTTTIAVFAALVWLTARSMNVADFEREQARAAESEMRVLAEVDSLTGALNRRSLCDRLEREWSRAQRHGRPLSAVMLDIDFFKQINDARGHGAGDALLRTVASLLREHCRPSDLVCRYGGDEFCILVPDTDEVGATTLAERLCASMSVASVTGSFGVAERLESMAEPMELIELADQALLSAKRAGRDRVMCASREFCLI